MSLRTHVKQSQCNIGIAASSETPRNDKRNKIDNYYFECYDVASCGELVKQAERLDPPAGGDRATQ